MRLTVVCLLAVLSPSLCFANDVPDLIARVQKESGWPEAGRVAFRAGIKDWNEGRFLSARNNWVRARGWMDHSSAPAPCRDAMAALTAEADRLSRPPEDPVVEPSPSPTPEAGRPRKRVRRRAEPVAPPLDAGAIMDSARVAREAGQTEKAIRLMRIASGMPGGEKAAAAADELERELLQPAR